MDIGSKLIGSMVGSVMRPNVPVVWTLSCLETMGLLVNMEGYAIGLKGRNMKSSISSKDE